MSDQFRQGADGNELRLFVPIGIVFLLLLMLFVNSVTKPPAPPPNIAAALRNGKGPDGEVNYIEHPEEASARVKELSIQVKGDYDKLSQGQQHWFNAMSAGHGPQLAARTYKDSLPHTAPKGANHRNTEAAKN